MSDRVTQTILAGREDGVPGNCIQAAVATLLGLPLDAVPHVLLFDLWPDALRTWAEDHGWTWVDKIATSIPPVGRCIVAGQSPRGVAHVCVAENGEIVWDPHPSRAGLVSVIEVWFFNRQAPAEVTDKGGDEK